MDVLLFCFPLGKAVIPTFFSDQSGCQSKKNINNDGLCDGLKKDYIGNAFGLCTHHVIILSK